MTFTAPDDATLIEEHLRGSPTAFMQLWTRYDGMVYGIAHSLLLQSDGAEDARQEVFLRVYSGLARLRESKRFASWLRSITYNVCRSQLRERRPTLPLEAAADLPSPSRPGSQIEEKEQRHRLRQAIDRLPLEYRQVIELHYYESYSVAQIAEFLELPETTIKWRLYKARETLKRQTLLS